MYFKVNNEIMKQFNIIIIIRVGLTNGDRLW